MNTTVNALKNLYEAMGGEIETVENVNRIPDMIDELCNVAGQSIKPEDEGKVVQNGALVVQTSKNITENGTHDTTANNQVVVNVQSNPNSIETINGTFANPFGELNYSELISALKANAITIKATATINGNTQTLSALEDSNQMIFSATKITDNVSTSLALDVSYDISGNLARHSMLYGGNIITLPDSTVTTLTLIHHPMPETP